MIKKTLFINGLGYGQTHKVKTTYMVLGGEMNV